MKKIALLALLLSTPMAKPISLNALGSLAIVTSAGSSFYWSYKAHQIQKKINTIEIELHHYTIPNAHRTQLIQELGTLKKLVSSYHEAIITAAAIGTGTCLLRMWHTDKTHSFNEYRNNTNELNGHITRLNERITALETAFRAQHEQFTNLQAHNPTMPQTSTTPHGTTPQTGYHGNYASLYQ